MNAIPSPASPPRIEILADLPEVAGQLSCRSQGYHWQAEDVQRHSSLTSFASPDTGGWSGHLEVGSVRMEIWMPSNVSRTACLTVAPPHRFVDHVDGVILMDRVVSIGATARHTIRHSGVRDWYVFNPPSSLEHAAGTNNLSESDVSESEPQRADRSPDEPDCSGNEAWRLRRPSDGTSIQVWPGRRAVLEELSLTVEPYRRSPTVPEHRV